MNFVLFVLHDTSKCDALLDGWEEAGVKGVTILTSTGLGRIRKNIGLRDDFPLFPSLADLTQHSEKLSRTFFTVVDNDEIIDKLYEATIKVTGPLEKAESGIFIVLPISRVHGLKKDYN